MRLIQKRLIHRSKPRVTHQGEQTHSCPAHDWKGAIQLMKDREENDVLKIGWAEEEITPQEPVLISGQFHVRRSEGVLDPLTVTAWALESGEEHVVFVSCDVAVISDELRD